MTGIGNNYQTVKNLISEAAGGCGRNPEDVLLVAVSKRKPVEAILEAIEAGASDFGENYIQEAAEKIDIIGREAATWHFIGHLQSNKAKIAVRYFDLIHTVDSLKLAREIDKQARKNNKVQDILLQINIGYEETKSGSAPEDVIELAQSVAALENISIQGLMGMPPYFPDPEDARKYFRQMAWIRDEIIKKGLVRVEMNNLSMGMSNDFKVAIEEGSTMVRVGTSIFGRRD